MVDRNRLGAGAEALGVRLVLPWSAECCSSTFLTLVLCAGRVLVDCSIRPCTILKRLLLTKMQRWPEWRRSSSDEANHTIEKSPWDTLPKGFAVLAVR